MSPYFKSISSMSSVNLSFDRAAKSSGSAYFINFSSLAFLAFCFLSLTAFTLFSASFLSSFLCYSFNKPLFSSTIADKTSLCAEMSMSPAESLDVYSLVNSVVPVDRPSEPTRAVSYDSFSTFSNFFSIFSFFTPSFASSMLLPDET